MRFFLIVMFICGSLFAKETTTKNLIENVSSIDAEIDWTEGVVRINTKIPYTPKTQNIGRIFDEINNEINDNLKSKVIKVLGGIKVADNYFVKDYYNAYTEKRYKLLEFVEKTVFYPSVKKNSEYQGSAELPLYGKDSIIDIFFQNLKKVEPTNYIDFSKDLEYYDSVVIDLSPYPDFSPSLAPRIYDEDGVLVFGPETVDYEIFKKTGLCFYTKSLTAAFSSPRTGKRVFYIVPKDVKGELNTDIVIFNEDSKKLLSNRKTLTYLRNCNVIIVKP
ncbi:MAG: hypothetical protein N2258_05615 [Brevinematales bacterium]|nr:hypothetical protein [Brevinematales bacterium]